MSFSVKTIALLSLDISVPSFYLRMFLSNVFAFQNVSMNILHYGKKSLQLNKLQWTYALITTYNDSNSSGLHG